MFWFPHSDRHDASLAALDAGSRWTAFCDKVQTFQFAFSPFPSVSFGSLSASPVKPLYPKATLITQKASASEPLMEPSLSLPSSPVKRKPSGEALAEEEACTDPSPKRVCTDSPLPVSKKENAPNDFRQQPTQAMTGYLAHILTMGMQSAHIEPSLELGNVPQSRAYRAGWTSSPAYPFSIEGSDIQSNARGGFDMSQVVNPVQDPKGKRPERIPSDSKPNHSHLPRFARSVQRIIEYGIEAATASESPQLRAPSQYERLMGPAMPYAAFVSRASGTMHVNRGIRRVSTIDDAGCECSICVRALAKRLESAEPFKALSPPLDTLVEQLSSPPDEQPGTPCHTDEGGRTDPRRSVFMNHRGYSPFPGLSRGPSNDFYAVSGPSEVPAARRLL
ncbi:hypothetical protein BD311DRAFT_744088 [Dichomitus squalens]|uniref:Uncharacterized protein n=1 Tax=Dichomitus squalens TaxID=114155 RepID=A0A4Q9N5I0_9APHY|nr:hypothetical protein BD311DRAFT_744088 [Dichomitus squalens]